jgi:ferric-dicitrate binding protein FerR (iron transport regulator)
MDPIDLINNMKPLTPKKSKEQVWAELEGLLEKPVQAPAKVRSIFSDQLKIAASIILIASLGVLAGLRFYTTTINCLPGQQKTAQLPDGSTVQLNAQSSIKFNPYWWKINREVNLEGEGYFKVQEGKKFTVISNQGSTAVLGTSFNIYARDNDYEVTCLTGQVYVVAKQTKDQIIITPNQMVKLNAEGNLDTNLHIDAKLAIRWTNGKFIFTQVPLHKVLSEIGRQYNVSIKNIENLNELYTGSFSKEPDVETVLDLISATFNISYTKSDLYVYTIQENK